MKDAQASRERMGEKKLFKDWFDAEAASMLAARIGEVYPRFPAKRFCQFALEDIESMEFAARVRNFSNALSETLPADVPKALEILTRSLPEPLPDCDAVTDGWLLWPVGQFIADHGLDYFEDSFEAMIELTQRFTSEFAVRPFVERYPERTLERLLSLTSHPNPHVRRWCSEGSRTRLPWGRRLKGLIENPGRIVPILESLRDDPEIYVRRSVANNWNDLTKDHPAWVMDHLEIWSDPSEPQRAWIIARALRGLVKEGHPRALELVGYSSDIRLDATLQLTSSSVRVGDFAELILTLNSRRNRSQNLLIDYIVRYVRANGASSPKVFKWTTMDLEPRVSVTISKRHPMRVTTVRALYPGIHRVVAQINGKPVAEAEFDFSI